MRVNYYYKLSILSLFLINLSTIAAQDSNTSQTANTTTSQVDPLLTDVWGGVNCVDDTGATVYPSNYYTPSHCSPGCVAISLAQVLHYYEWPKQATGLNVYEDDYNGTLKRHRSSCNDEPYDWDNMLDEYKNKPSTDIEQKAIGRLMYDVGIALQMDYEPGGSTSNINKTPFVYTNFFKFSSHYEDANWPEFWPRLYQNIQQGRPVPVAVKASRTGAGHVVVVNGYKEEDGKSYYYLNWGTYNDWNVKNGWYDIQSWTEASSGYNTITGASFDVLPNPEITSVEKTGNGNDFTVNWEVSQKLKWQEFTLEQKADQGDWQEVAVGITSKNYTINSPTAKVYQFRVKAKVDGEYYVGSWSEVAVFAVEGGYNGIVCFDGTNQYAYARQTPDYDLDFLGDYTFETWIKLKDGAANGDVILDQQNVFGFEISDVTSTNYKVVFKSHSSGTQLLSNTIQIDQWAHIAVSKSGNATKMFVNGTKVNEYSGSGFNLTTSNLYLNFGEKYRGGYSSRIVACFDQLRISSIGRYSGNFTPSQDKQFDVDNNTVNYSTFQDVHKIRLKDSSCKLAFFVKNESGYAEWEFEFTDQVLANEDFELLQSTLNVYPNPVTNQRLNISFSNDLDLGEIEINMFDLTGRKLPIKSNTKSFNSWNILLQDLSTGIYILQIKGEGFAASRKIIIQ
ncbi:MAG: C10 family peptidase [Bacteroidota bacterium]